MWAVGWKMQVEMEGGGFNSPGKDGVTFLGGSRSFRKRKDAPDRKYATKGEIIERGAKDPRTGRRLARINTRRIDATIKARIGCGDKGQREVEDYEKPVSQTGQRKKEAG